MERATLPLAHHERGVVLPPLFAQIACFLVVFALMDGNIGVDMDVGAKKDVGVDVYVGIGMQTRGIELATDSTQEGWLKIIRIHK